MVERIKGSDPPDISPELRFLNDCLVAISNQEYRNALEIMGAGMTDIQCAGTSIDAQKLASLFSMTVEYFESKLKDAYGEQWERRAEIPEISEKKKEMRCSFCGKEEREVEKIIAGADVFICNDCVGICNQILEGEPLFSPDEGRT